MGFCGRKIIGLIVFSKEEIIIGIIHACPYYLKANRPTTTTPLLLYTNSKLDIGLRSHRVVKASLVATAVFLYLERIMANRINGLIHFYIDKLLRSRGIEERLTISIIIGNSIFSILQRILNGNGCFLALGYFVKVSYTCLTQGFEQ